MSVGTEVEVVAGEHAGSSGVVEEVVGTKSAWVYLFNKDTYATIRMSSLEALS